MTGTWDLFPWNSSQMSSTILIGQVQLEFSVLTSRVKLLQLPRYSWFNSVTLSLSFFLSLRLSLSLSLSLAFSLFSFSISLCLSLARARDDLLFWICRGPGHGLRKLNSGTRQVFWHWVIVFDLANCPVGVLIWLINVTLLLTAVPSWFPNSKQKQGSLSNIFSRSELVSKQQTETGLTFWYILPYLFRTISIETETETSLTKSHLNLWQFLIFVTKMWTNLSCLLEKLNKNQSVRPRSQIQNFDISWPSQMSHIKRDWYCTCFCFVLESGSKRLSVYHSI